MTDNPSNPPTPSTPDFIAGMDQMRAELAQLRQQQTDAQTTNTLIGQLVGKLDSGKKGKIWIDKPDKFDGKIGDAVENWLKGWELWFKHREKQDGTVEERTKIETAMQSTVEKVKLSLARHERDAGEWSDWASFKKYMTAKYMSTDSGFARYLKLKRITQRNGETVESYYQRFDENIDRQKEDDGGSNETTGNGHKKVNNQYNYLFVDNLHSSIKPAFLRLPEARDFQKRDLYEVRELATRVEESVSQITGFLGASTNPTTPTSKPPKKFRKNRDTDEISREKLKHNERTFLTNNVAKGGGTYIFPNVQKKLEWIKWARKDKLCMKCAAKGHVGENCTVAESSGKESNSRNGKDRLHTTVTTMEEQGYSEMNTDSEYLCSIRERDRKDLMLMMYDCEVNRVQGTALADTGATLNYISSDYASRSNIPFLEKCSARSVQLPSGDKMNVLGHCTFLMTMGEWSGRVQATILDIKAEFDVILGLSWHCEWRPVPDWDSLDMLISTAEGVHRIEHKLKEMAMPKRHSLTVMREYRSDLHFNLISEKEAKRDLKQKHARAMLYFIREDQGIVEKPLDPDLCNLLQEFKDCLRDDLPDGLPPERDIDHAIETGEERPSNKNAYPLSTQQLREQTKQVEGLLKRGLIRESSSPWGAPVLFVAKKTPGEWRMCIDYRALNARTIKNAYPLPRIQECIDKLGNARHLSSLDLLSGYWQVRVADKDIQKTAFNTRYGKYEFLVMPFGLTNAPATFQTLMNSILRPYIDKFVLVYLDDILIYSNSLEEHLQHLRLVFETLRKHKLYARPVKCVFNQPTVEFCGHLVGQGVVRLLDAKVKAIQEWPQPRNVQEVRQFYGLVNYYRRFIRHFSIIAAPLSSLFKSEDNDKRKRHPIVWGTTHQVAFQRLKEAITSAPVLVQPDPNKPYMIETDSSDFGNGMALYQEGDDGKFHPIAFDGRKLHGAELKYPTHEKELLAIKEALQKWHHYVENGLPITIITDHESLKYMNTIKHPSKRIARWVDEFQQYNLIIKYRPGSQGIVPDALSRRPDYALNSIRWGREENEEYIPYMRRFLTEKAVPQGLSDAIKDRLVRESGNFMVEDDILYRRVKEGVAPYVEFVFRGDLMERIHRQYGHLSFASLKNVVATRAWWPSMDSDLRTFVSACPNCQVHQRQRGSQEREVAQLVSDPFIQPFQRWGIDLIGRLPKTKDGNRWIITAVDYATGWPIAKAIPKATEEAIAEFIYSEIYMHFGAPQEIFTDGGKNLWGGVVQKYLEKIGTLHKGTSPYHPRTNGKVERLNGIIVGMLGKLLLGKPTKLWDLYLDQALLACRVRTNATTKTSPFYLVYGKQPHLFGDVNRALPSDATATEDHEERFKILQSARQEAAAASYERAFKDKETRDNVVTPHKLDEGEWVLVRHEKPHKFETKWFGPYQIVQKMLLGTYRLQDPNGRELAALVHGNRLVKATVNTADELRDLWASLSAKDALRKRNVRKEDVLPSYPENTDILDAHLQDDEDIPPRSPPAEQQDTQQSTHPFIIKIKRPQIFDEITVKEVRQSKRPRRSNVLD